MNIWICEYMDIKYKDILYQYMVVLIYEYKDICLDK